MQDDVSALHVLDGDIGVVVQWDEGKRAVAVVELVQEEVLLRVPRSTAAAFLESSEGSCSEQRRCGEVVDNVHDDSWDSIKDWRDGSSLIAVSDERDYFPCQLQQYIYTSATLCQYPPRRVKFSVKLP
jgi:hypothetical protein